MSTATPQFSVDYRREHGVHSFESNDGTSVVSVSTANWHDAYSALLGMPETDGYIMTPELITTAGAPLEQLRDMGSIVDRHTSQAYEASTRHPRALLALGTVGYTSAAGITNQLAFIQDGEPVGVIDKVTHTFVEKEYFSLGDMLARRWSSVPAIRFAICAEMVGVWACIDPQTGIIDGETNVLDDQTRTLLASSCWAVPMSNKNAFQFLLPDEQRYRGQLEKVIDGIFKSYPNLQDVIMTDRRPSNGTIEPLNAHFRRQ